MPCKPDERESRVAKGPKKIKMLQNSNKQHRLLLETRAPLKKLRKLIQKIDENAHACVCDDDDNEVSCGDM